MQCINLRLWMNHLKVKLFNQFNFTIYIHFFSYGLWTATFHCVTMDTTAKIIVYFLNWHFKFVKLIRVALICSLFIYIYSLRVCVCACASVFSPCIYKVQFFFGFHNAEFWKSDRYSTTVAKNNYYRVNLFHHPIEKMYRSCSSFGVKYHPQRSVKRCRVSLSKVSRNDLKTPKS